ncbi:hypothetical protein TNCV_1082471 [Trichonephila clavipes]|nr:hypothetical protein TNCV_1082471 [Trichonephila clavipes]
MFGDNFAKELQSIPLSNDTVSRRIDDIAEDVEHNSFSITHEIHLGQLILQSAQYAYPYIIKLIYMGEKATEKYYLQLSQRKVDGVKHTSKFKGQRDDNQKDRRLPIDHDCDSREARRGNSSQGAEKPDIQNSTLNRATRGEEVPAKGVTNKQNSNQQAVSPPLGGVACGGRIPTKRGADEKLSHEGPEMKGQRLALRWVVFLTL